MVVAMKIDEILLVGVKNNVLNKYNQKMANTVGLEMREENIPCKKILKRSFST